MSHVVAIVGRPNVGKSTLYNRLIGGKHAIVDNISGVTRDRLYGTCEWNGKSFTVIDTGGFVPSSDDIFESAIREQVQIALDEATIVLFVVDVTTGVTDLDESIANVLRKSDRKVILAVNKVDNHQRMLDANEFWSLGFEECFFIASLSGSGTGDMLDAVVEYLPEVPEPEQPEIPRFAVVGQPNVGKSSFVNALLGEKRHIVTEIAGTTRDSIHSRYTKYGKDFILIDTAGLRKKSKVHENLEFYSVIRTVRAVEEADVCFILIDAKLGIESQDMHIFDLAIKRNKGIVFLINKWDLIEKETMTAKQFENRIREKIAPFSDVPVLFVSVLEKQRIYKALEVGIAVFERRSQRIKTSDLNNALQEWVQSYPPPSHRGRFIKIKYATQLPVAYPAFAFFCNHPKHVKQSYRHYLENQLRKKFNFTGVPMRIYFRQK